jgi:hypothetical protein
MVMVMVMVMIMAMMTMIMIVIVIVIVIASVCSPGPSASPQYSYRMGEGQVSDVITVVDDVDVVAPVIVAAAHSEKRVRKDSCRLGALQWWL